MTDTNTGAQRFGAAEQQRAADAQRTVQAGTEHCSVIVVLSPTSQSDDVVTLNRQGQMQNYNFTGVKSHDRLVNLLSHVRQELQGEGSAYDLFLPKSGVPAEIVSHESLDNGHAAKIVRYSVNLSVAEMRGKLSRALFDIVGDDDLNDVVAGGGIFAIYLVDSKQAVNVLQEIERQFDTLRKLSYVSVADVSDQELEQPLIDFRKLPGASNFALIEGVKRSFVVQNSLGQLVTFSNSVGEQTVAPQNKAEAVDLDDESEQFEDEPQSGEDEELTGKAILGYQADQLTIEQKTEALTAIGYDVTDWEEEAIADTFLAEQEKYLEENGDSESDDEESEDEESEEEAAEFDAVDTFSELLDAAQYDRQNLKRVIIILGGKCFQSDTEETLTAKILANIAERELDEADFVALIEDTVVAGLNERNADATAFTDWLDADQESDEEDEESEEESDEEEDGDDEEQADDEDELGFADPLDAFDHDGAQLSHDQRVAALEAMGSDCSGLNNIQVMKLFRATQAENGQNTFEQDASEELEEEQSEVEVLLATADEDDLVTILNLIGVDFEPDADRDTLIELIENSGASTEEADNLYQAALTYGLDASQVEGVTYDDLLAAFLIAYFSDTDGADVDDEEDPSLAEAEAEFDLSVGEQIVEAAGKANDANPLGLTVDNSESQKFLVVGERTLAGQLMSVDMPQSLIINFTLTDRSTFEDGAELADIDNVNYLFPFNKTKSADKAQGSMWLPAAAIIETMTNAATSRFLVDRNQFDVEQFSEQLNDMFSAELRSGLYEGLLEAGEDPREVGIKTGDFVDDELLEEGDIDPEYWKDFAGDDMPLYTFINGHITARPITIEERNSVLCLGVLNIALPGVWSVTDKKLSSLIDSAVNAVKSLIDDESKINVYVGFTLSSGSLIVDTRLSDVVDHLRTNYDEMFTYSSADCALFADNEDVLETAASLDNVDRLPLEVLSSGSSDRTFENGGDLTILIPLFEAEEISDEDEDEDVGDDE